MNQVDILEIIGFFDIQNILIGLFLTLLFCGYIWYTIRKTHALTLSQLICYIAIFSLFFMPYLNFIILCITVLLGFTYSIVRFMKFAETVYIINDDWWERWKKKVDKLNQEKEPK